MNHEVVMKEIVSSIREDYGVDLIWKEGKEQKNEFFSYSELIDMKINVLDLLEHPNYYKVDGKRRKVRATPQGCCQIA
jgi:hypothetical protein